MPRKPPKLPQLVSDWKRALNSSSVPGSASRNPIWSCRCSSQSAPGWRQSWPKGKLDCKHCAQKRDRRPKLNAATMDVGAELKRMQAVIDDLLRERSQWKGSRPVGSTGVVEGTMIAMDVGTLVDNRSPRMEAMIDEAGSKRLRVEGASSSVCREGVGLLWFARTQDR